MKRLFTSAFFLITFSSAAFAQTFVGSGIGGAEAAKRGVVQLWNPASSTVSLHLKSISIAWTEWCNPNTHPPCQEKSYGEQLGADLRVTTAPVTTFIKKGVNKILGGTSAQGEIRVDAITGGALPSGPIFLEMWTARRTHYFPFDDPIIIPPGYGVIAASAKPDSRTEPTVWYIVDWQWEELSN